MSFRRVAAMASAASVASAAASGTIKLDWSDCADSSTHGHITSLSPDTVVLGTKTPLAGRGTVDEAITGATYKVVAKALGVTVFSHTGDACKPETIQLPAGTGNITMKGFSCPIQAGPVELDLDLSLSASIPASLARTTIDLTASATSGDKALCVQIKTSKATTEDPVDPVNLHLAKEQEVAVSAGTLGLTWKDCGDASTHGKTTSVTPASLILGQETDITGKGTTDKTITGGTYDMHLTAGGGLINQHFTGNNCEAKDFNLPLGLGSLSWKGIECPLAAGATELHFGTKLSATLPASLATSDIALTAKDQDGDSALCVNLHLAKQGVILV